VEVIDGAAEWSGTAPGPVPHGSIELLKLHGSLNWAAAGVPLSLRSEIFDPVALKVIQAPLTNKPVTEEPFNSVWKKARRAVRAARRLIVIGYSMPVADGLVRSLFATDLESVLQEVVIVEPDPMTRNRHIDFFTRVADSAKVFVFTNFAEFAELLS
jgi:hypothetical protein